MKRGRLWQTALAVVALSVAVLPANAQETGSISGILTDADTGEPIADEYLFAYSDADSGSTYTNEDGSYEIRRLLPGTYLLEAGNTMHFTSDYVHVWWPGVSEYEDAGDLTVVTGESTEGVDLQLEYGGVVRGVITDAWTGEPIPQVSVAIDERRHDTWAGGLGVTTDDQGRYRLGGLKGEYRLSTYDSTGEHLVFESAPFAIAPGEEIVVDQTLTPAYGTPFATIGGVACEIDASSTGCWGPEESQLGRLAGVTVEARSVDGSLLGTATTDEWGGFTLENLRTGTILVGFKDPPAGMEDVSEAKEYRLGPNEGVWDVELRAQRVEAHLSVWSAVTPREIHPGEEVGVRLTVRFSRARPSVSPFEVSNVVVRVHLPAGLEYVEHSGIGTYDPSDGMWTVQTLPYLGSAQMTITVSAAGEGSFRPHAEILESDWPDSVATHGDGRGDDYTSETIRVTAPTPVEQAIVGGTVFRDSDEDGVRDPGERILDGVTVVALDETGLSYTAITGTNGDYRMSQLPGGTFTMKLDTSTLPDDVDGVENVYVISLGPDSSFLDADFACIPASGTVAWWLLGTGALLLAAGASSATWLLMRRRSALEPLPAEAEQESITV